MFRIRTYSITNKDAEDIIKDNGIVDYMEESLFESLIQEITVNDLKKDFKGTSKPHDGLVDRSKDVDVRLEKITDDGVMHWTAKAVTTKGVERWKQEVKLKDWDEALELDDLNFKERANLAIFGDLEVSCNDPSWLYWGYKYIATQLDYNEGDSENRAPKIRNPNEEGVVCKHLISVLKALPFYISEVAGAMKKVKGESFRDLIDNYIDEKL